VTTAGVRSESSALNAILADSARVRRLGPGLYTALPEDAVAAPYDRRAAAYDAVVGRSLYHRIFWGTSARAYTRFARAALEAGGGGYFAEAGCGSLLFTAGLYREMPARPTVLVDRSVQMLRRAGKRLRWGPAGPPDEVAMLHADLAAIPVHSAVFSSVLCLNVVHVPCDAAAIIAELSRILIPGRGRLFVSSLIRSGRWSDRYLAALHRLGELAAPMSLEDLYRSAAGGWGVVESANVEGNMCYLVVRHAGQG